MPGTRTAGVGEAPPLVHDLPDGAGTRLAFSGRAEGNVSLTVGGGDAAAARRRVLGLAGLGPDDAVFMRQVHRARVARVGPGDRGRGARDAAGGVPGTDALVTTAVDVGLVVMVADCVPVLLSAQGEGVAAVHAGRRGVVAGVVPAAVAALARAAGGRPADMSAYLGPAIGGCCYEVSADVGREVATVVPAARATTSRGTPGLDLPAAVTAQLEESGVGRVRWLGGCTRCHPERWFSHRASAAGAPEGRQAGVVRMGAAPPRSGRDASLD